LIDFEKEFVKGSSSYEGLLAEWWVKKSRDASHRRAYRNISESIRRILAAEQCGTPEVMIDYACGNGAVLKNLVDHFPSSTIVALDGSSRLLSHAYHSLERAGIKSELSMRQNAFQKGETSVKLVQAALPDFSIMREVADVVIFVFPNLSISNKDRLPLLRRFHKQRWTMKTARMLAKLQEIESGISAGIEVEEAMLDARAISLNIHRLLKKGGYWFQIDYANAPREEWDRTDQWISLFEESAWDVVIEKHRIKKHFSLKGSWFFKSSVMLDVYEQSGDPDDREGGYVISLFQSI
jgi:hypothetical protein